MILVVLDESYVNSCMTTCFREDFVWVKLLKENKMLMQPGFHIFGAFLIFFWNMGSFLEALQDRFRGVQEGLLRGQGLRIRVV